MRALTRYIELRHWLLSFAWRPRLGLSISGSYGFFAGRSLASMAVPSRQICPIKRSPKCVLIKASRALAAILASENSSKAREKVDSDGSFFVAWGNHRYVAEFDLWSVSQSNEPWWSAQAQLLQ